MGGGGDGLVKGRPAQGRAVSVCAAVYPHTRTAEDAPRDLFAPDQGGENSRGEARRGKGTMPALPPSAGPPLRLSRPVPQPCWEEAQTNDRRGRPGLAMDGGHALGIFPGSAGAEAGQVSKPHSSTSVIPAQVLGLRAAHPPAHTSN